MNEDKLNELLERCESPIERELLIQFYPHLLASHTREPPLSRKHQQLIREGITLYELCGDCKIDE